MKKTLFLFCCSLFVLTNYKSTAQTYTPSFYLDLGQKSCYIQSLKVDKGWEITLHNFSKNDVHDTTFTLPIVTSDTLLKIINQRTGIDTSKAKRATALTQKERDPIDNILPVLFQSSVADRLAGQFIVSDSIEIITSYERRKIKFNNNISLPIYNSTGVVTYKNKFKPLTTPEDFDSLYTLQQQTSSNKQVTLLGFSKTNTEKRGMTYTLQEKDIKTNIIDSTSFSIKPINGLKIKTVVDSPIGLIALNASFKGMGQTIDSLSVDIHVKSIMNLDTAFIYKNKEKKTVINKPIYLSKKIGNNSLEIKITPFGKKNIIDSIIILVKKIHIENKTDSIYVTNKTKPKTKYADSLYLLIRKKSNDIRAINFADLYSDKNFVSTNQSKNTKTNTLYFIKNKCHSIVVYEQKQQTTLSDVSKIQMDIKDGFIENVKVECKLNGKLIIFKNLYPICISSKTNLDLFKQYYLFSIYEDISYKICLKDLLIYNYEIKSNQLDISPSDTSISLILPVKTEGLINAKKEDQDKIFEYRIYTDVIGLNETNPNGLVQIEAHKKINLWGRYYRFIGAKAGIGYFQYADPSIKYSKIEKENSFLVVNSDRTVDPVTKSIVTVNHITPLELLRYQQLAVVTDFNIFRFYNDNFKFKANIDINFGFGQTKLRDSIYAVDTSGHIVNSQKAPIDHKANTMQMGMAVKLNFFPDARWGFDVGIRYNNITLLDQSYEQTNIDTRTTYKEDKWINRSIISPEFELHKCYSNGSKFYARYVFNAQTNKLWYNFVQFQIGYNAYLKF